MNFSGGRTRSAVEVQVETLASGLGNGTVSKTVRWPLHDEVSREELAKRYQRHERSSTLVYGLLAARIVGANGRASPLLIAELDDAILLDAQASEFPAAPPALFVNRALVNRLCTHEKLNDDAAEPLANDIQDIVDSGPIDKARLSALLERLRTTLPSLQLEGFDTWPLLSPLPPVDNSAAKAFTKAASLHCSAAVLIVSRSRQSTSVLHELEALARIDDSSALSTPLRQLTGARMPDGSAPRRFRGVDASHLTGALSAPQRQARRAASEHALSVVIGPPGTGKTHTLAALAAECVAGGGSVLVCARNRAAVDVAERFLGDRLALQGAIMRGGDIATQRQLKSTLKQVLTRGEVTFKHPLEGDETPDLNDARSLHKAYRRACRDTRRRKREITRLDRKIRVLTSVADDTAGIIEKLEYRLRCLLSGGPSSLALATTVDQRRECLDQLVDSSLLDLRARLRRDVRTQLERDRPALTRLADSFTAREQRQLKLQASNDYRALLTPMPVWVGTLADLGRMLPMQAELFDLILIDEASQIDPASALPALQRAKRAVVFGDAAQLQHMSFLPQAIETELLQREAPENDNAPGFRNDSLLDWVSRRLAGPSAINLLDEHFRSAPPIIGFSNQEFYDDRLALLTRVTQRSNEAGIEIVNIESGHRDARGVNRREASALVARCVQIVEHYQSADDEDVPAIGVISPFRAQVDHLTRTLNQALDDISGATRANTSRHRLIVGTAHELQGEERDIILFSAAVDDTSAAGALYFLSRPDVLNVAITRAKHQQIIFLSRAASRFDRSSLFGKYLNWIEQHTQEKEGDPPASHLQQRNSKKLTPAATAIQHVRQQMIEALQEHTASNEIDVRVGSVRIDLLVRTANAALGIDFIGFDNSTRSPGLSLADHGVLYRIGLPIIPVTIDDWTASSATVIDHVRSRCEKLSPPKPGS